MDNNTPREPIMQFFKYDHLPPDKQATSKPFGELAEVIHSTLPRNPERTVALRKLLEAKDAAVRAGFMVMMALLLVLPFPSLAAGKPTEGFLLPAEGVTVPSERPSITFANDADTGFYRTAEGTTGIVVGGTRSPVAEFFAQFLTPTGIASAVVSILGLVGGLLGLSAMRKRQIAIVTQHAYYGVLDFAKTTETDVDDKVAAGLKIANDWMMAHGWRPLSPQESEVVKLGFNALHGRDLPLPPSESLKDLMKAAAPTSPPAAESVPPAA